LFIELRDNFSPGAYRNAFLQLRNKAPDVELRITLSHCHGPAAQYQNRPDKTVKFQLATHCLPREANGDLLLVPETVKTAVHPNEVLRRISVPLTVLRQESPCPINPQKSVNVGCPERFAQMAAPNRITYFLNCLTFNHSL